MQLCVKCMSSHMFYVHNNSYELKWKSEKKKIEEESKRWIRILRRASTREREREELLIDGRPCMQTKKKSRGRRFGMCMCV